MAIDDLKTRTPVVAAVDEWNRIGASAFRSKHGAGAARRYFLVVGNTRYDLKPVMAAAHNLAFPKKQPLRSRAFHTHVARSVAERLGFDVFVSAVAADVEAERLRISESEVVDFDPKSAADGRTRTLVDIVKRQGQAQFRKKVLEAYDRRCAVSGCDVEQVLDAAHIVPYRGPATNHVTNGILLRADLHTLFDLLLISVNPQSFKVEVSPQVRNSVYREFHGRKLRLPSQVVLHPNRVALEQHRREADVEAV